MKDDKFFKERYASFDAIDRSLDFADKLSPAQTCKCGDDKFHRNICEPLADMAVRLKKQSTLIRIVFELAEVDGFEKDDK